jgi:hypothetical protein
MMGSVIPLTPRHGMEVKTDQYLDVPKGHFMAFKFMPDTVFVCLEDYELIMRDAEHAFTLKYYSRSRAR